jgi:hypothetical protein
MKHGIWITRDQWVDAILRNNDCLLWESYKTHVAGKMQEFLNIKADGSYSNHRINPVKFSANMNDTMRSHLCEFERVRHKNNQVSLGNNANLSLGDNSSWIVRGVQECITHTKCDHTVLKQFTSQKTHCSSVTMTNRLMLFRKIIAVYSQNHSKYSECGTHTSNNHCLQRLVVHTNQVYDWLWEIECSRMNKKCWKRRRREKERQINTEWGRKRGKDESLWPCCTYR